MKILKINNSKGFTLLEVMVAVAIIGVLASIAIPKYMNYRDKAVAASCLTNRHYIDMEEQSYYIENDESSLQIDDEWSCPAGGHYVWIVSDPDNPRYPEVGCSMHYTGLDEDDDLTSTQYENSFDSLDEIDLHSGKWEIKKGSLTSRYGYVTFGPTMEDMTMTTTMTISDGNGGGIIYRATGPENDNSLATTGYAFQIDPGMGDQFVLRTYKDGGEPLLARSDFPPGFDPYAEHIVEITAIGSEHSIKVDGNEVLTYNGENDPDDPNYTEGKAGFRAWNKEVAYKDVSVQSE